MPEWKEWREGIIRTAPNEKMLGGINREQKDIGQT